MARKPRASPPLRTSLAPLISRARTTAASLLEADPPPGFGAIALSLRTAATDFQLTALDFQVTALSLRRHHTETPSRPTEFQVSWHCVSGATALNLRIAALSFRHHNAGAHEPRQPVHLKAHHQLPCCVFPQATTHVSRTVLRFVRTVSSGRTTLPIRRLEAWGLLGSVPSFP